MSIELELYYTLYKYTITFDIKRHLKFIEIRQNLKPRLHRRKHNPPSPAHIDVMF